MTNGPPPKCTRRDLGAIPSPVALTDASGRFLPVNQNLFRRRGMGRGGTARVRHLLPDTKVRTAATRSFGTDDAHNVAAGPRGGVGDARALAEGVEQPFQLAHLRALGCERSQGRPFARSLPLADFERLLADRAARVPAR